VEPHKEFFWDDTGLNGVRLLCDNRGQATSSEGPHGTWRQPGSCPARQWLVAFRLRVEALRRLWDNTAANAVAAICLGGSVLGDCRGPQGTWSLPCPPRAGVCGLRTHLEQPQRSGDDTGLNYLELYCCT
ncbi:VMO1 protein, partial [Chloropsis hardwickii]|nr:VMO1 protein [Chloropsis hardwickii]